MNELKDLINIFELEDPVVSDEAFEPLN